MKIIVREDRQIKIRAVVPVAIQDISSEIEKVKVRMLSMRAVAKRGPSAVVRKQKDSRQITWSRTFSRVLATTFLVQSLQTPEPVKTTRKEPKTKTIEIKITLPSLPKIQSVNDVKQLLIHIQKRLAKSSLKVRIAMGVVAVILLAGCYELFHHSPTPPAPIAHTTFPTLTKGTPNYATILPSGKTIQQLGGWTRVSPQDKNPVYAYVDRIDKVQVDVSEQPLPANFQVNTEQQVAQLAKNFNATEKIPAGSTNIYIATFADDSQAVILDKDNVLLLMKSVSLLPPTQWVSYVESLNNVQSGIQ